MESGSPGNDIMEKIKIDLRQLNMMYDVSCTLSEFKMETFQFSSVQTLSHVRLFAITWNAAKRPLCPSPTRGVYLNAVH